MKFVKGADVYTAKDEKIGTLSRVVIDAKTGDMTDLVVDPGMFGSEKVIPVGLVDVEKEDKIMLRETNQGVDEFLDYETTHYVPVDQIGNPYEKIETYYWYPPANYQRPMGGGMIPGVFPDDVLQTESSIPEGRVAISQGAQVLSADDAQIGNVEQVITDPESDHVTHFVIGKGFLLKEHKLIPAFWVSKVDDGKIHLSVQARVFERLPDYQPD
jgi:uncharacterized protein YrrD